MDGEYGGHESARPEPARHPPQDQKQQDRRRGVQQHIGEMVSPGLQPVNLAVQHVGHPRQRVPVCDGCAWGCTQTISFSL